MLTNKFRAMCLTLAALVCLGLCFSPAIAKRVPLSQDEILTLTYICEEEKLAKEVYEFYFSVWPLAVFENIAKAEAKHLASVQKMLLKYNLPDPTLEAEVGEFTDPNLQDAYNWMTDLDEIAVIWDPQDAGDEVDAFWVGGLIEETDIVDIEDAIANLISNSPPLLNVYENLLRGSGNHLRAFVRNLEVDGIFYTPQVLTQEEFDEIVNPEGARKAPR
jgi:hypothetical protein